VKLGLCLLTLNELEGCKSCLDQLPIDQFEEVFAVDGNSTDGTVEFLTSMGIKVYSQDIKGYNGAYITAFRKCNSDAVVFYHPKGTVDPQEVLKFRPYFDQGYELVVASRIIEGAHNEEDDQWLKPRKWFVMGLGLMASVLWRKEGALVWDVLHGFRAMTQKAFLAMDPIETGLSMDLEMVARSYKKKFKCIEFPVAELPRPSGETHFKAFPTGKRLLKYMAFEFFRKG